MMSTHLLQLLDKARAVINRPLKLKQYASNFLISIFSRVYDRVIIAVNYSVSTIFVLLYDLLVKTKKQSIETLVCLHRFEGNTGYEESIEKRVLEDTLINCAKNRSEIAFYYWDKDQPVIGGGMTFYRKITILNPKYLVLSSYSLTGFYQPMPWILTRLKKRNIHIIALWWDTCSRGFAKSISPIYETVDVHGIMDNPNFDFGGSYESELLVKKARRLFYPCDFVVEERKRDIDVAFFGQVSSYRNIRKSYLDFLLENNVSLYYSAYGKDQQCSNQKYHEVLSRAKIGINFSMSVDRHQLKARVFEILQAGSLLLEQRNEQTAYYFKENVDYVAFASERELLEKIKYYLAHEDERREIAESGHRKARRLFSGKQFWDKVLNPDSCNASTAVN